MRETRFRAWDASEKEMVSHAELVYDPDDWLIGLLIGDCEGDILMQYTGLKDKNGKEIYESDRVKIHGVVARPPTGVINWVRAKWVIGGEDGWPLGGFNSEDIEVIGNIYENPELLES